MTAGNKPRPEADGMLAGGAHNGENNVDAELSSNGTRLGAALRSVAWRGVAMAKAEPSHRGRGMPFDWFFRVLF